MLPLLLLFKNLWLINYLWIIYFFPCLLLWFFSLSIVFWSFTVLCLDVDLFLFSCLRFSYFLNWRSFIFFINYGKLLAIEYLNIVIPSLSYFSFSGTPIRCVLDPLILYCISFYTSFVIFTSLSLTTEFWVIFSGLYSVP